MVLDGTAKFMTKLWQIGLIIFFVLAIVAGVWAAIQVFS